MAAKLYFIVFSLIFSLSFTHVSIAQELIWEEQRPLRISDFKGKALSQSPFLAMTYSTISHSILIENNKVLVRLSHVFDTQKSWMKKAKADSSLLAHEQLHFDISELHARKMQKTLEELVLSDDILKSINKVIAAEFKKLDITQNLYDKETNHGTIESLQKQWSDSILIEMKNYPEPLLEIQLELD